MRHIVIDTNCLVQIISQHSPYRIVWQAFREGKYYLCISNEIIEEYQEILTKVANEVVAKNIVNAILRHPYTKRFDPRFRFNLIKIDPDDNKFVDCAIIANADYIVSEDNHFSILKTIPFPRVNVISIEKFITLL